MEIKRNNYEEYFLLFADNELTDYEKIEVLKFIRENKDLEHEFKLIQDTICKPENVALDDKSNLLRETEAQLITKENYEEIFVLYHDNELNDEEKSKTESFVRKNPQYKIEFDLFAEASLDPDNFITFNGKQNLYKNEKAGRVVPIIFWRSVAAAVFIGFGFWVFQVYYQQPPQLPGVATSISPVNKTKPAPSKNAMDNELTESNVAKVDDQNDKPAEKESDVTSKEVLKNEPQSKKSHDPALVQTIMKNRKQVDNNIYAPVQKIDPEHSVAENKIASLALAGDADTNDISFKGDIEVKTIKNDDTNENIIQPVPVSYNSAITEKNENYVFYNITTEEFRKSKVGGFLKKLKRIVERNNPISRILSGDDKQLVSN